MFFSELWMTIRVCITGLLERTAPLLCASMFGLTAAPITASLMGGFTGLGAIGVYGEAQENLDASTTSEETAEETPPEARVTTGGFHSMPPSVSENNKKNTYDSNSSSNFDSYNKHAAAEGGFNGYSRSLSQPGYAASGPRGAPTDKYR